MSGFVDQNEDCANEDGSPTDRGNTIIGQTPMGRYGAPEDLLAVNWLVMIAKFVTVGYLSMVDLVLLVGSNKVKMERLDKHGSGTGLMTQYRTRYCNRKTRIYYIMF